MSNRPISWENFKETVLTRGEQRVHRFAESPRTEVFWDGQSSTIGMFLEVDPGTNIPPEISKLTSIASRVFVDQRGGTIVEITCKSASLYRAFFQFAVAVAAGIVEDKRRPLESLSLELQCFANLLESSSLLGMERQLGLLGELLFLAQLISRHGNGVLDSWLGPQGEPHDFRIATREYEVKTTVLSYRNHTINGLDQMVPSSGCSLYLVSVVLGPAGADGGFSLADKVQELSSFFGTESARATQFAAALSSCGYREQDKMHYGRRFAVRRPLAIVKVDNGFPAISRLVLQNSFGCLSSRLESVTYEVDVEGLEYETGTPEFEEAIVG